MKMEERLRNSVRQGVFGVLFLFFHQGSGKDSSEKGWEGICSGQSMKNPPQHGKMPLPQDKLFQCAYGDSLE